MAVNLHNWLHNPAPGERNYPEIHGYPVSNWIAGPNDRKGQQPQSVGNPAGQLGAVPVVGIDAEMLALLCGPQYHN